MVVKEYKKSNQLLFKPLNPVECLLCVSKDHPLAKMEQVSQDKLQEYVELSVHDSSEQDDYDVEHLHFGGEKMFFLSDFQSKKQALLQGIGFGWMPYYLVKEDLEKNSLTEINYSHESRFSFTPYLVWRAEKELGKTAKKFIELISDL